MLWYVLHVASNTEHQVCSRLQDAKIETFFPHLMGKSIDGRRAICTKFFPGYVFARFDLATRTPVVRIPQVIRILGWSPGVPAAIPTAAIEAIRLMITKAPDSVSAHPHVVSGDPIEITCGLLAGMTGVVVYIKGKARVVVSIQMLGRAVSAEVAIEDIALARAA